MIRQWQASPAADAARAAGSVAWRRTQAGGQELVFTPTAPSQPQTFNERPWVQIVNRVAEASIAPHPESELEELLRINSDATKESHSTCQHAGCEFEGTHEEVRTHEESCDRR
jgi:hypothetical protein